MNLLPKIATIIFGGTFILSSLSPVFAEGMAPNASPSPVPSKNEAPPSDPRILHAHCIKRLKMQGQAASANTPSTNCSKTEIKKPPAPSTATTGGQ